MTKIYIIDNDISLEDMVKQGILSVEQAIAEMESRKRMKEHGDRLEELAKGLDKETRLNIWSDSYGGYKWW